MKVYDGYPWFNVFKRNVKNLDGSIKKNYHFIESANSVLACLVCVETQKIILLKEFKPGLGKVCYTLPGGQVEKNEDNVNALKERLKKKLVLILKNVN